MLSSIVGIVLSRMKEKCAERRTAQHYVILLNILPFFIWSISSCRAVCRSAQQYAVYHLFAEMTLFYADYGVNLDPHRKFWKILYWYLMFCITFGPGQNSRWNSELGRIFLMTKFHDPLATHLISSMDCLLVFVNDWSYLNIVSNAYSSDHRRFWWKLLLY